MHRFGAAAQPLPWCVHLMRAALGIVYVVHQRDSRPANRA
jgi:hypothetical protein